MNCKVFRKQLSAYIDGELFPWDRERVKTHLAACTACSAELSALKETMAQLRTLPRAPVPAGFRQTVWARIDAEGGLHRLRHWLWDPWYLKIPVGAVATAAVAVLTVQVARQTNPELAQVMSGAAYKRDVELQKSVESHVKMLEKEQAAVEEKREEAGRGAFSPPAFPEKPPSRAPVLPERPSAPAPKQQKPASPIATGKSAVGLEEYYAAPMPTYIRLKVSDLVAAQERIAQIVQQTPDQQMWQLSPTYFDLEVPPEKVELLLKNLWAVGQIEMINPLEPSRLPAEHLSERARRKDSDASQDSEDLPQTRTFILELMVSEPAPAP